MKSRTGRISAYVEQFRKFRENCIRPGKYLIWKILILIFLQEVARLTLKSSYMTDSAGNHPPCIIGIYRQTIVCFGGKLDEPLENLGKMCLIAVLKCGR